MLQKIKFTILLCCISCSFVSRVDVEKIEAKHEELANELKNYPAQQIEIIPGKVKLVNLKFPTIDRHGEVVCRDRKIKFHWNIDHLFFVLNESYFSEEGEYSCHYNYGQTNIEILKVKVIAFEYPFERIYVDQRRVVLNEKDQKRVEEEQIIMSEVYKNSISFPLFKAGFKAPLNTYITSHYGSRRIFNQSKKTQHLGTDFRAKIGLPIPTSNTGKVVFTGNLFYSGNTIVIDHGLGIFSIYGHLSKIMSVKGDLVQQSTIIGLSGATGRVSGPHLHWGLKINNEPVDGFSLIEETKQIEKLF